MEIELYELGTPSWVDLGSPDPAAAAADFYSGLFGWEVVDRVPTRAGTGWRFYAADRVGARNSIRSPGLQVCPGAGRE